MCHFEKVEEIDKKGKERLVGLEYGEDGKELFVGSESKTYQISLNSNHFTFSSSNFITKLKNEKKLQNLSFWFK